MCIGEKRTLTIPSSMAYGKFHFIYDNSNLTEYLLGSRGAGGVIPPNAALVFETELVSLEAGTNREEL